MAYLKNYKTDIRNLNIVRYDRNGYNIHILDIREI